MTSKRALLAALLGAALSTLGCGAAPPSAAGLARVPVDRAEVRGPADAFVTVVEFGDFQCPFCRQAEPVVRAVLAAHPSDVRLSFRHFPLGFHADARPAALAAECARSQGRFWQMHDLLLTGPIDEAGLRAAAAGAGLAVAAWEACRRDPATAARLDADVALGTSVGVGGTPAFAVNGELHLGAPTVEVLGGWVEAALARARASGIPAPEYYDRAVLGL